MKFIGLDGKEYSCTLKSNIKAKSSKLHQRARSLLKELFPFESIIEELPLLGSKTTANKQLYGDFFLPHKKYLIEIQGEQHEKYNSFFYDNKLDFLKAKARDSIKADWCKINEIILIKLSYNESDEEWKARIGELDG